MHLNANARLAVSEMSTYRWGFEEDVMAYAMQGFKGIGVCRYKLQEYGEAKAVELLHEFNLSVSSLHWVGGFTGSDGRSYRDALLDALEAVDSAAALRASCLVVLTGSRAGHAQSHLNRLLRDALRELSEAAAAMNVRLALEPMHRGCAGRWTLLTDITSTMDLIQTVDRPNLGLVFDAYHLAHDSNVIEWLPSIAPKIELVQLGDAVGSPIHDQNRCLLGDGHLPLREIVEKLEGIGYAGFYEVELFGETVEHLTYDTLLEHSQSICRRWLSSAQAAST
jgi:sugar phosphate isomerase/epimerase